MKIYETVADSGETIAAEFSLKAAKAAGRAHGGKFVVWRSVIDIPLREALRLAIKGGGYATETEIVFESPETP